MDKYRCVKQIDLQAYDEDASVCENKFHVVNIDEIYEHDDSAYRLVGGKDTIHLANGLQWIEILPETLKEYFELLME